MGRKNSEWKPMASLQSGKLMAWVSWKGSSEEPKRLWDLYETHKKPHWTPKPKQSHHHTVYKRPADRHPRGIWSLDLGSHFIPGPWIAANPPQWITLPPDWWTMATEDSKAKNFWRQWISLWHSLGVLVVAKGLKTRAQWNALLDLGADWGDGDLLDTGSWSREGFHLDIQTWNQKPYHRSEGNTPVLSHLEYLPPISQGMEMDQVLEYFRRYKSQDFFPVLDADSRPLGLINEKDLKEYVFSPYGKDILKNRSHGKSLDFFIKPALLAETRWPLSSLLEVFQTNPSQPGLLMTSEGVYKGFLSSARILQILHEEHLTLAQDSNPLTRLPGNRSLTLWMEEFLADRVHFWGIAYFDLDHFKAFNDKFGFRLGDRAILMLAENLSPVVNLFQARLGHIGGDDFVVVWKSHEEDFSPWTVWLESLMKEFHRNASSFFSSEEQDEGSYPGKDRQGREIRIPLLRVSVSLQCFPPDIRPENLEILSGTISGLKSQSKGRLSPLVNLAERGPL